MIMLSARDWRDAVENGDVDAIIIPTASSYYNSSQLVDRSEAALEQVLPPSAVWLAEQYTKVTTREQAFSMVTDSFGRLTPSYLCCNVLSDRMIKPHYNAEGIANDKAPSLPPVIAVTVCNMLELPPSKLKHVGHHIATTSTSWLYEASTTQISAVIRDGIARAVEAVRRRPDLTSKADTINIGIAPLFNEQGYRPLAGSRADSFRLADNRQYINRMIDLLGRHTYPTYVTLFYNPVKV